LEQLIRQAVQLECRRLGTTYPSNLLGSSSPRKIPRTGNTAYFSRHFCWTSGPL